MEIPSRYSAIQARLNYKENKRILLLLILIAVLYSCTYRIPNTDQANQYFVVSLQEKYPEALKLAQEWNSDALLFLVQAPIYNKETITIIKDLDFTFESPTDRDNLLTVYCSFSECYLKEYKLYTSWIDDNIKPININDVQIDSTEAARIALNNGGDEYMENKETNAYAYLARQKDGRLLWKIDFSEPNTDIFRIDIDPTTGEVIKISDN